jgi:hypothetical protein
MGQFSWMSVDTDEQIYNDGTEAQEVTMVYKNPQGEILRVTENDYDGYGEFGGIDLYDAVCMMNNLPVDRSDGIDLYFSIEGQGMGGTAKNEGFEWPQLFLADAPRDEVIDFTIMPVDDPNQGWGEPEHECDECGDGDCYGECVEDEDE